MVKKIFLSGKKGAGKFALVDDDMYELLSQYSWNYNRGYAMSGAKAKDELGSRAMHRVVNQTPDGMYTDHIDRNTLNNQQANLRSATPAQNATNRSTLKGRVSKYKGVSKHIGDSNWRAYIGHNGKLEHLGSYSTQRAAAKAYNDAAIEYHGEYASTNDIKHNDSTDVPTLKKRQGWGKSSKFTGVFNKDGVYYVHYSMNGTAVPCGSFPDEIFAARIYDAAVVHLYGTNPIQHVNFICSIDSPLDINARYVFRAKPLGESPYAGVPKRRKNASWVSNFSINGKQFSKSFHTAELAAEHYDKNVLIYRDSICTYLNFPEKLNKYLSEIGDKIISGKPIIIPDLSTQDLTFNS